MNTKDKPWLLHVGASGKGLSPTIYGHKGPYWRTTPDATVTAFMDAFKDAIMQILYNIPREHTVKSRTSRVLFLKLFQVQFVWCIQSYHFSGIFYPKRGLFRYRI